MIDRVTTMQANGPPPDAAATLYPGEVMHQRLRPFGHRFTYSVFSLLVDIDRLDEASRLSPLLRINRPGLVSFQERDHAPEGQTLRAYADGLLSAAGLAGRCDRILLLAYPRIFGYVFNPISVYFCYAANDDLVALIYAVRNTFGESHVYVAPVEHGDIGDAGVRQTRAKIFHVSPFIDMDARYHFRILPPGKVVRLRIHETQGSEPLLAATFAGSASPLTSRTLAGYLLKIPFMTWKIVAGIHWEALKLWLKGAVFHRSPPAPAPASYRDSGVHPEPGE